MIKSRSELRKPLGREGYRNSSEVASAIEKGGYGKVHANLLTKVLANWMSAEPVRAASFDAKYHRYEEALDRLKSNAIKDDGGVHRLSAYGLALMVWLSAPGVSKLASACSKAYDFLRKKYFEKPEDPWIVISEFETALNLDSATSRRVILLLNDMTVCSADGSEYGSRVSIYQNVCSKGDIWRAFESLVMVHAIPISTVFGTNPLTALEAAFGSAGMVHDVIAMCPNAHDEWKKAQERLMPDPSGAITSARSMVEAAIKWIHHERRAAPPSKDGSTGKRLKECLKLLDGDGADFEKPGVKQMITGMETAINSLDAARNAMGDGHGKPPGAPEAGPRVARLIVGLATTVTTFLLATYESRQRP